MLENLSGKRAAVRLVSAAVAALLLLTACQTTPLDPAAEKLAAALEDGVDLASFKPDPDLRVRYLPPVGEGGVTGEFVVGLPLEVFTFRLAPGDESAEGAPLGTKLGTSLGGVSVAGDTYTLTWPVLDPNVAERVRIEIRLPGSGDAPVCNEYGGECLGFLDVRVVEGGGPGHGGGASEDLITVPSGGTFTVSFKVLVPKALEELAELSGEGGIDVETGNCPANELALPGQGLRAVGAGLRAVGAAGGLFLAGTDALDGETVTTQALAAALSDAGLGGKGATGVALVVLDDFGGVFQLPREVTDRRLSELDIEALVESGAVSHGALVFHELTSVLSAVLGNGKAGTLGGVPNVTYGSKGATLLVQAVDARSSGGTIDTEVAAANLTSALSALRASGYLHVVVNMSFAVVPCGVLNDFTTTDSATFQDYLGALLELNGVSGQTAEELRGLAQVPVGLLADPLFAGLACPLASGASCGGGLASIAFVAASGNYGLDFPLYPAAFPGVISVGSQPVDSGAFVAGASGFSNAAPVLAPGDLVLLRTQGGLGLALGGTSFAAPVVAAFTALDLRTGSPTCAPADPADPTESPPELATGDLVDPLPLLDAFAGGGASAVAQLCGG